MIIREPIRVYSHNSIKLGQRLEPEGAAMQGLFVANQTFQASQGA